MVSLKDFNKLSDLLYRRTGISISQKRYNKLKDKLERLITQSGFDSFRSFFRELRFNKETKLIQDLINTVTINETYFYREKHQFDTLVYELLPQMVRNKKEGEPIRILCAPSSTGEEPYSIILYLLDEAKLIEQVDFEIVGIDIDNSVIQKAKNARFSKRSVQYVPPKLLRQHFTQINSNLYEFDKELKDAVNFKVVNVMDKHELRKLGKFDIIFSRNMLIYFDDISRQEVATNFYQMLKPNAYIFLGHAESMSRISSLFTTVKMGQSIFYKKQIKE
ncbi:MAG: CheR family methyltransferase [Campylobacterota bacterium]